MLEGRDDGKLKRSRAKFVSSFFTNSMIIIPYGLQQFWPKKIFRNPSYFSCISRLQYLVVLSPDFPAS